MADLLAQEPGFSDFSECTAAFSARFVCVSDGT
jgi:hypothetical protein